MAISYAKFKRTFGNLGITEWVKFNWLSNAGIARNIYNKVVETGYNPLAYINDELYNHITNSGKFLVLVGSVDLGSANWTVYPDYAYIIIANRKAGSNIRYLLSKPRPSSITIFVFNDNNLGVVISYSSGTYTTKEQIQNAFKDTTLYYELATPVLIDL